jgi:hypothetical protein
MSIMRLEKELRSRSLRSLASSSQPDTFSVLKQQFRPSLALAVSIALRLNFVHE